MKNSKSSIPSMVHSQSIAEIENTLSEINENTAESSLFNDQAQLTLRYIASIYAESNPSTSPEDYLNNFVLPVLKAGIDPYEILKPEHKESLGLIGQPDIYRPLIAALVFCHRSVSVYKYGQPETAWAMLVEASFWCGCAAASDKMYDASRIATACVKREEALARLQGREKIHSKRVAEVAKLMMEKLHTDGWDTYTHAASVIQKKIIENPTDAFPTLSDGERGQRTISDYIEEAVELNPELGKLIRKEKKAGRPKKD
jgi:hypothetical protein